MIDFPIEKILTETEKFGITLTEKQITNLNTYANLLVSWNEKMNLTAITEPEEVVWKHFYDCMLFFKYVNVPRNAKIIDVWRAQRGRRNGSRHVLCAGQLRSEPG